MEDIEIIYEDKDIVAVNKPAGMNVHPDEHHKENTLIQIISQKYPQMLGVGDDLKRPGVVHRLDRDTSGVLVLSKNQKSFEYLKNLFKNRLIKKTYIALVCGKLKEKTGGREIIELPLARSAKNPVLRTAATKGKTRGELKTAITEYKTLKFYGTASTVEFTLVEAYPKTGRTHQIRAHFKVLGHPVLGDKLYGNKKVNDELKFFGLNRQFLHALSLELTLPSGSRIKLETDLPNDLKSFLEKLNQSEI